MRLDPGLSPLITLRIKCVHGKSLNLEKMADNWTDFKVERGCGALGTVSDTVVHLFRIASPNQRLSMSR